MSLHRDPHGHAHPEHGHLHPHGHSHSHSHAADGGAQSGADHRERRAGEGRRLRIAIALTLTIFVAEVVGGVKAHFLSLLADAGHMLSDVAAQVISLAALYIASRPSDRRRTFGWYRVEILAALGNGAILLALAAGVLWSAVHRIGGAHQEVHAGLALGVAAVGLLANLAGAWLLHGAESLNVRGAYLHVVQDTLSSAAVLAGGIALALRPTWYLIDPLLSIAIALFVSFGALRLLRDAVDVLLETVPHGIDIEQVTQAIKTEPSVCEVHDLHLWTITSGIHALAVHVVVDGGEGGTAGHDRAEQDRLIDRLKQTLQRDFRINHTTIQVESTGYRRAGLTCERCED